MDGMQLFWGDTHCQYPPHIAPEATWRDYVDHSLTAAAPYLDFMPVIFYPALHLVSRPGMPSLESRGPRDEFGPYWEAISELTKRHHRPGEFVTFPGYEWTGDRTRWGDHNVVYLHDDQPLDLSLHIDELYANLRARDGIAIPHHTAYAPEHRSKDWAHYDELISPFAEIFSGHGCSESDDSCLPMGRNSIMGPRVTGNTVQDGLAQGCRVGIIASQDGVPFAGRHGAGLMACYARELTRESLWEAFHSRRVYGVTGDRIELGFSINDHMMGDVFTARGPLSIRARAVGTQAIDRIELIRDNRVVATHCHQGTWAVPTQDMVRVKLQVEHGWGLGASPEQSVVAKEWNARISASGCRIESVEGRFSRLGQEIMEWDETSCIYRLITHGRACAQSIVLELEGSPDATVTLDCGPHSGTFSLRELLAGSRVLFDPDGTERCLRDVYGVDPREYDTVTDKLYGCSYKVKIHQAVPESGYTAELEFGDDPPKGGRSFYYVRVSQLNGQYAWSSPIWVDA
ncbi:MAG: DUF3604 domain-containing protein [Lentisphaerae bacterium]|jgi:hypothetical protein|nr:DUF3604 domain-containing protein [Lentisphaerota bacterium]MBT4815643.1 DUF3604 domain-containing protein [Lentisphaerota bacterium]MBT5613039.1 DUF3604 domain-containing protein [Lentisphaerota bacterium]MBT7056715.1 DUF3604 domain-containing protein [Lentisphaerota bacterium]MBT7843767.1 DUF3604 domain-containing protein [Lentisphaerota bacterium]